MVMVGSGARTSIDAVAWLPEPALEEVTVPVVFTLCPPVVPTTFTEKVHEPPAAIVPPDSEFGQQHHQKWNCITCGCCYAACGVTGTSEKYLGPAAINKARWPISGKGCGRCVPSVIATEIDPGPTVNGIVSG